MNFEKARTSMIEKQLIPRGILNKAVLDAMRSVPRHIFISKEKQSSAYGDFPLPTMSGQTISQPYIVAYMTQILLEGNIESGDIVLEIGTGAGYQTAVLAAAGLQVITVERLPELTAYAKKVLSQLDSANRIRFISGDGTLGCPTHAPYKGILVTAASPGIPAKLTEQLDTGGRLLIPCGDRFVQKMKIIDKTQENELVKSVGISCRFVPLIGTDGF